MMRSNFLVWLLLGGIFFIGCGGSAKRTVVADANTDFPVVEKLEFKVLKDLAIGSFTADYRCGICVVDGPLLWYIEKEKANYGVCYDLATGEKLADISRKGGAENEVNELTGFRVVGDAVMLYDGRNTIKTFVKQEIMDNVLVEKRKVKVTTLPDNLWVARMAPCPNGNVLATIRPPFDFEQGKVDEINKKSVALFDGKSIKSYETIDYDSFDLGEANDKQVAANEVIKWTYAQGLIETKGNEMAVLAVSDQFILYTLALNSGEVVNEKRYSSMKRTEEEMSFATTNDMCVSVLEMKATDKYIVCKVEGYLSEEDKEMEWRKEAIFVFDWNLKPMKKFELPDQEEKIGYYTLSNDGQSVYFCEFHEDGLTLNKADLNI